MKTTPQQLHGGENVIAMKPRRRLAGQTEDRRASAVAVIVVGAIAASALAEGLYDFSRWSLLAAGLLAVLTGLLISGQIRSFGVLTRVLLAIVLLAGWAALSMLWADSVDRAWTETNRLVLYGASLAVLAGVLRSRQDAYRSLAIVGGVVGAAALWTVATLLAGDAGAFLDHRLNSPIGYINGTAGLFLMGLWPLIALAERSGNRWLAGSAMALAIVEANLLVLTQSRAIVPALLISVLIAVAVFPGRARRAWTLLTLAAGTAAASPWTLAVYADRTGGRPAPVPDDLAQGAALAALAAAVGIGAVWTAAHVIQQRPGAQQFRRAAAIGTAVVALLLSVGALVAAKDPVGHIEREWRAFTTLQVDDSAQTRFTGAGGFRHDLWRVALDDIRRHPLEGVGAGSYGLSYYQHRRQQDVVRQPHSLPLQILAELGIVGGLLMLVVATGAAFALLRDRRREIGAGVAGGGMAVAWATQTSVDWLYNLPGLTCMAIVGLVAASTGSGGSAGTNRQQRMLLVSAAVVIAVASASLGRQYAAQSYARSAQKALARDPATALSKSATALSLNSHAMETYYTRAAAFARFDAYSRARDTLMTAAAQEPLNFVPWALQGDLAVRRGDLQAARDAYGRALRLNPRDPVLAELAGDPEQALR